MTTPPRPAFTMIELIFVIVVLGIVSSIGAEMIANVYEQYIIQRAKHRASLKVDIAATQIANRLAYAITGTVTRGSSISTMLDITNINSSGDILQWVGADMDSFNARKVTNSDPAWNGYCDINKSLTPLEPMKISLPSLKKAPIRSIHRNLSQRATRPKRIYFLAAKSNYNLNLATQYITSAPAPAPAPKISEHYKLAWSSYALQVDGSNDLKLHYDFSPTITADIATASSQTLLNNVSTFVFKGNGRTINFKLCIEEPIGSDFNITSCQERAVF